MHSMLPSIQHEIKVAFTFTHKRNKRMQQKMDRIGKGIQSAKIAHQNHQTKAGHQQTGQSEGIAQDMILLDQRLRSQITGSNIRIHQSETGRKSQDILQDTLPDRFLHRPSSSLYLASSASLQRTKSCRLGLQGFYLQYRERSRG